ncbi:peptide/nickel transport system permease protein [Curtobacterium pusillum]|uniref:Peptide/nickel transport system permease protein n=1 Tax=Curtobacterium pusillum TaxID=69373 RepID=A0AAW3T3H8_9MICO|nr:ABC transporter permease [Curtobacterium pusillum]MBA8989037.1 peptide/nickel transport system permease protein [Curtobacterium pusillum]
MLNFLIRRLVSGIIVLFVVSSLTFFLLYFSATSVARNILGESATAAQVHQKEIELGLDAPLVGRYLSWLGGLLRGDFGTSWFTSQPVLGSILSRLPATLSIVFVTIVVVAVLSTLIGVAAAVRRGRLDRTLQIVSVTGSSIPQFVVAILIVTVFAIRLHWFPATGYVDPAQSVSGWAVSIVLPVAALAVTGVASTAQQVRSATIGVLQKDYVRTLRSRGVAPREILFKHVLRGAAPTGLTVLSLQFINLLGGVVVIEQIFALPGMGFIALQSTTQGDMPVLMGVVVYVVLIVVIVNLLVDLAVGWLNPKARVA